MLGCILNSVVFLQRCFVLTQLDSNCKAFLLRVSSVQLLYLWLCCFQSAEHRNCPPSAKVADSLSLTLSFPEILQSFPSGFDYPEHCYLVRNTIYFLLPCQLSYVALTQSSIRLKAIDWITYTMPSSSQSFIFPTGLACSYSLLSASR